MDDFAKKMLYKIDSGEPLTSSELSELVYDYDIDTQEGDDGRWFRGMYTVVELGGRHFGISWFKGLTECQDNEFDFQPEEVERHEKMITGTGWLRIKRGK